MSRRLGMLFGAVVLTVGLSACAAPAAAPPEPPTPTEVVEQAATENQVASVIAEYEPDWREVIDTAGECRFLYVLGGSSTADELQAMSCYLREQTILLTTKLVLQDLNALTIPDSMTDLVESTAWVLEALSTSDLKGPCGEDALPNDSDFCSQVMGSLNGLYLRLDSELNKWRPYL